MIETQRDLAKYWLLNLVRVVVGFVVLLLWLAISWALVAWLLYPAGLQLFTQSYGSQTTPEQSGFQFPLFASWIFIAINLLAGAAVGYLIVRSSARRQMLHAILLAIGIFAVYLDAALTPGGVFPKWIIAVLMSGQAIVIVAGARLACGRVVQ